jgi:hypothetical protein
MNAVQSPDVNDARDAGLWREFVPKWTRSLSRRAAVEQLMFDAANGKRPMPAADELRQWALKLGTPEEAELRSRLEIDDAPPGWTSAQLPPPLGARVRAGYPTHGTIGWSRAVYGGKYRQDGRALETPTWWQFDPEAAVGVGVAAVGPVQGTTTEAEGHPLLTTAAALVVPRVDASCGPLTDIHGAVAGDTPAVDPRFAAAHYQDGRDLCAPGVAVDGGPS